MKNLLLTCLGYTALGIGLTIQAIGKEAGLELWLRLTVFTVCLLFFAFTTLTSLQKVKSVIQKKEIEKL